jgi:hypothetical protein
MIGTQTDSVFSFTGWIRRGRGPWRLFCRGASEQAVLEEMLRRAPRGSDKLVRQGDSDPNRDGRRPRDG